MGKIIDRVRRRERGLWLTKARAEAEDSHRRLLLSRMARPAQFVPTCGTEARLLEKMEQNIEALTKCEWFPNVLADRPKPRPWWAFWRR